MRRDTAFKITSLNCCFLILCLLAYDVNAESLLITNSTLPANAEAGIVSGFKQNDIALSVFNLPEGTDAFRIQQIQLLFMSHGVPLHVFGNINLYCGVQTSSTGISIGAPSLSEKGLGISPGMMNTLDVSWLVYQSDGPFAIGFEYLWQVGGEISEETTHICTDKDGCHEGKNFIFDNSNKTWLDACSSMDGDFIIQVIGETIDSKSPFIDFDKDNDVDQSDFGVLQSCLDSNEPKCLDIDCDGDGEIGLFELQQFMECSRGPSVPPDPNCGTCLPPSQCLLGSSISHLLGEKEFHWIIWIIIIIALVYAGIKIKGCANKAAIGVAQAQFISAARPIRPDELELIRESILYLRDTLGPHHPLTRQIGAYLWDNDYHKSCCLVEVVPLPDNPKNFIAVQPPGTPLIVIYEEMFTKYSVEKMSMVLFAEGCHLLDPGFYKEHIQQQKLEEYREVHGVQNLMPQWKHGAPEGAGN